MLPSRQAISGDQYCQWVAGNQERPRDAKCCRRRPEARGFRKRRLGHNRTRTVAWAPHQGSRTLQLAATVHGDAGGCGRETPLLLWNKIPLGINNNRTFTSAHDRANVRRFTDWQRLGGPPGLSLDYKVKSSKTDGRKRLRDRLVSRMRGAFLPRSIRLRKSTDTSSISWRIALASFDVAPESAAAVSRISAGA